MFDIGSLELFLSLLVCLIVIGPKKMPEVARFLGKYIGHIKSIINSAKQEFYYDETVHTNNSILDLNKDQKNTSKTTKKARKTPTTNQEKNTSKATKKARKTPTTNQEKNTSKSTKKARKTPTTNQEKNTTARLRKTTALNTTKA